MNMNPANQGNTQGGLIPGSLNNTGGNSGVAGGKTNQGSNMTNLSQPELGDLAIWAKTFHRKIKMIRADYCFVAH